MDAQSERLARRETLEAVTWDSGDFHYFADVATDGPLTCQYVFVLDALNFCFWPTKQYVCISTGGWLHLCIHIVVYSYTRTYS